MLALDHQKFRSQRERLGQALDQFLSMYPVPTYSILSYIAPNIDQEELSQFSKGQKRHVGLAGLHIVGAEDKNAVGNITAHYNQKGGVDLTICDYQAEPAHEIRLQATHAGKDKICLKTISVFNPGDKSLTLYHKGRLDKLKEQLTFDTGIDVLNSDIRSFEEKTLDMGQQAPVLFKYFDAVAAWQTKAAEYSAKDNVVYLHHIEDDKTTAYKTLQNPAFRPATANNLIQIPYI